ncbi:N-acetylmuramoyl-L-alanine amidase [Virgibacillus sp. C22-A2]|uniref:N-acetylmuramoyl-L-alanine amidase n=1 Tax=Virgibacillus tibetensis TaxID=3042313 RepID=A0ABU6K9Y0_9BACI|nr:N-acetylmuramoyl-L-alanine amidase [Virgibacillus sp. C22-A2]
MAFRNSFILMLCMLLISITLPSIAQADQAIINADNLNIRNGPGTEYNVIGKVNKGEDYPILQIENDWVEIQLEEGTGWVTNEYITVRTDSTNNGSRDSNFEEESIIIQHNNTQMRSGPSTENEITNFADRGEVYEVLSITGDWYELSKEGYTGYVLKQLVSKNKTLSSTGFKNKTIVIDAGHGGRDVGAIGATGIFEKDIAYLTAQELAQELRVLGAEVLLTRSEDEFISLGSRVSYTNMIDTDAFISIHYDSVPELPQVTGIESFFYHSQDQKLAEYIQSELVKETEAKDRGTTHGNLLVIRQNLKPSVLLELGFLSNTEEEALLTTGSYQKSIVSGIVNGLGRYFSNE